MMKKRARAFQTAYLETGRLSEPLQQVYNRSIRLAATLEPRLPPQILTAIGTGILGIVMEELSGGVYIPTPKTLARLARDHRIKRDFNGSNHRQLAGREGVTERHIRNIVNQ